MGSGNSSDKLVLYGSAVHPICGKVTAYSLKEGGGTFVMKTQNKVSEQRLQLLRAVSQGNHNSLIAFYGTSADQQPQTQSTIKKGILKKLSGAVTVTASRDHHDDIKKDISVEMYWEFLNWDIPSEVEYLKSKEEIVKEQTLWEIMDSVIDASTYLKMHEIYLQVKPRVIQFTAGRQPRLYWCDIMPNNLHRGYQHYVATGELRHTIYAPEELIQMSRVDKSSLNVEKCVVFNLGMTLLQFITKEDVKKIYNYSTKTFSEVKKREYLEIAKNKYSSEFQDILRSLVEYFPKDRPDFKYLQLIIDKHFNRNNLGITINFIGSGSQESQVTFGDKKQKTGVKEQTRTCQTINENNVTSPKKGFSCIN